MINLKHQTLTLDVKENINRNPIIAHQGDKGTRFIDIKLTDSGQTITLDSNWTAIVKGANRNGTREIANCKINTTSNYIEVELTDNILAEAGETVCEITITEAEQIVTSQKFIIAVIGTVAKNGDIAKSPEYPLLTALLLRIANIEENADKVQALVDNIVNVQNVSEIITNIEKNKTAIADNKIATDKDIDKLKTTKLNYTEITGSGGDLNQSPFLAPGVYQFKGATAISNLPAKENFGSSPVQGTMLTFNGQLTAGVWCIVQVFIGQLNIYQRRYTYNEKFGSGSWSNWVKVATDEDIKEIVTQGIDDETIKQAVEESVGTILEDKENVSNKVQTMFMPSESYYPSVKAVWDFVLAHLEDKEDIDNKTTSIDDNSTDEQYPSAKAVWELFSNAFGGVSDLIGGEE